MAGIQHLKRCCVLQALKQHMRSDLLMVSKTGNIFRSFVPNIKPAGHMLQRWVKWMDISKVISQDGKCY